MSYSFEELQTLRAKNDEYQGDGNDHMDVSVNNNIKELLHFSNVLYIESNKEKNIRRIDMTCNWIDYLKKIISVQLLYDNLHLIKVFKEIYNSIQSYDYIYIGIRTSPLKDITEDNSEFFPKFLIEKVKEGNSILAINISDLFDPVKAAENTQTFTLTPSGQKKLSPLPISDNSINFLRYNSTIGINMKDFKCISNDLLDYYEYSIDRSTSSNNPTRSFKIFNIKTTFNNKDEWFINEIIEKVIKENKELLAYVNLNGSETSDFDDLGMIRVKSNRNTIYDEYKRNSYSNQMNTTIFATFPLRNSNIKIGEEDCTGAPE